MAYDFFVIKVLRFTQDKLREKSYRGTNLKRKDFSLRSK